MYQQTFSTDEEQREFDHAATCALTDILQFAQGVPGKHVAKDVGVFMAGYTLPYYPLHPEFRTLRPTRAEMLGREHGALMAYRHVLMLYLHAPEYGS